MNLKTIADETTTDLTLVQDAAERLGIRNVKHDLITCKPCDGMGTVAGSDPSFPMVMCEECGGDGLEAGYMCIDENEAERIRAALAGGDLEDVGPDAEDIADHESRIGLTGGHADE